MKRPLLCRLGRHKFWEWGDDGMAMCRVWSPTCDRCETVYGEPTETSGASK